MARTKQTARKSFGGKAPRKYVPGKRKRMGRFNNEENEAPEQKFAMDVNYDGSYEHCFYAHYFENVSSKRETQTSSTQSDQSSNQDGKQEVTTTPVSIEENFAPRWVVAHPPKNDYMKDEEYWVGVSFQSKYDGAGIKKYGRPLLQLVFTLDVSGSMDLEFDGDENQEGATNPQDQKSKLTVAKEAIKSILTQLQDEDSFGLVTFTEEAEVIQPLTKWKNINKKELESKINDLKAAGGTNLEEGLKVSSELFSHVEEELGASRRIFYLTDMEADGRAFLEMTRKNSEESLFISVIGVGLDLKQSIIDQVSATPGCNYSNVRSTANFEELMQKEFGYLVTPIAFNIEISVAQGGFHIEEGFGSPELHDISPGKPFKLSTEFPSSSNEFGERRGGMLVFKLKKDSQSNDSSSNSLVLRVKHEDLQGIEHKTEDKLEFEKESFQTLGIRKAILLVRYIDFLTSFLKRRREPSNPPFTLKQELEAFIKFFQSEKELIGDETLKEELDFLNGILDLYKEVTIETKHPDLEEKKEEEEEEEDEEEEGNSPQPQKKKVATRSTRKKQKK